jgi:serine protease
MRRVAVLALLASFLTIAQARAETTGRLLVSVERGTVLAIAAAKPAGPRVPQIGLVTTAPRAGETTSAAIRRLRRQPGVLAVERERRATPRLVPNDPAMTDAESAPGTPPGTVIQWWAARMGLPEVWDVVRGDQALVAVIDSGVDGAHPDLQAKIRATIDADSDPRTGGPLVDEAGHGTHVASLACAAANNGLGTAGAGLDCGLIVAKTDFTDSSVASAIVQAADKGADAINLSFGTDGNRQAPKAVTDAIDYAVAKGAVPVAAAADQDTEEQGDPANLLQPTGTGANLDLNKGLSVTAATFSDRRAPFAGKGSQISLAAYGSFERGSGPRGLMSARRACRRACAGRPTAATRGTRTCRGRACRRRWCRRWRRSSSSSTPTCPRPTSSGC